MCNKFLLRRAILGKGGNDNKGEGGRCELSNRSVNKCCVTIVYSLPYSTLSFLRRLTRATCMALRRRQIIRGGPKRIFVLVQVLRLSGKSPTFLRLMYNYVSGKMV